MEGDTYQTGSNALMRIRDIREKEPAISVKRLAAAREAAMIAARNCVMAQAREPVEEQGAASGVVVFL